MEVARRAYRAQVYVRSDFIFAIVLPGGHKKQ